MNPSGVPLAQHAPPLSLLSTPRKEPSSPPSSYLPPAQSSPHNFWQYDQPEEFYKHQHHINETNFTANYHGQNISPIITSDYTTMAGTTALKSVQPSTRMTQRKEVPKSAALRSVSDPAHKLHPTRSSPAVGGVTTRSVKEIASRLEKKAESNTTTSTPSRPAVPKVVSRLPTAYRNPNASPADRKRAVSDIHSRIATGTRAGQVTRDVGTKSSGVARPSPRNKILPEHHDDITASRNQTQRTSLPRKQVESPTGRNEVSTPKSPLRGKPLLFGEISIQSPSAVGYGIPTARTRSTSDSAAERTLDPMDFTRRSPETSIDTMSTGQKREHARSQSDTTSRKQIPTCRPLQPQPPSSSSLTSLETPRRLASSISRLPTSTTKQVAPATPDSSRSNSPFKSYIKTATKTTFAIGHTLNNPRQRYGHVNASASQIKSPHTPEELSGSAQRTSRQGVAYKTTSASRNREREVSRTRTSSQTRRAPPTRPATRPPALNLGNMGNCSSSSTPVEGVDFSARQVEIRERSSRGIQKHEANIEIQRRQSIRQTNRAQRKMVLVNNDGDQNNNIISEAQEIHNTNFPTLQEMNTTNGLKSDKMASENVPLRLDTSLAPEATANQATIQALETTTMNDDDSPTLGMPGGYISSAQPSPMFEDNVPQSAISNVTDIEEELQLELQMPGSFGRISRTQNSATNNFSLLLREEEHSPLLKDVEDEAQTSDTSIEQTLDTIDMTYAPTPQRDLDLETENIADASQEKMASATTESEQVTSPTNNEFLLQSQVQFLRELDDDSLYERSSTPSLSNPRTSHIDEQNSRPTSHIGEQGSRPTSNIDEHGSGASLSWDDFSMTEATDVDYPEDYVEYKPPTPPPILIPDEFVRSFVYRHPPANPVPKAQPSPPLPQSPPRPEVPPKPAHYSPMPSPRQTLAPPRPSMEDSPLPSPRSGFGTATLISSHRRTSSSTPHYTPGTGWVAQPPVPASRPTSPAMDDDVFVDISAPFQPISKHDSQAQPHPADTKEQIEAEKKALSALNNRRHIIREVVDTEAKHVKDMYVIKEIWKGTADACPKLTEDDKALLFGNIDEIATFGSEFVTIIKKANAAVLKEVPNDDDLELRTENDSQSCIGGIFMQYVTQIEKINWPFIMKETAGAKRIETLLSDPTVAIWSKECCRAMVDISECWDLRSLLVKPFQRMIKYKDMMERLGKATDRDHPDYSNINLCFEHFKDLMDRLNEAAPVQAPQPGNSADKPGRKSIGKRKEAGLKKLLDLRTLRSAGPMFLIEKTAGEDERFVKLRDEFSSDFLQLQVTLRDVEYYTRTVHDFVGSFLKLTTMMEGIVLSPQPASSYPELESKWQRFSMKINHHLKQALNEHISAIRTSFITPFEQLIELYNIPNLKMAERAKRRLDWEKSVQKKGNTNKPDKNVERYLYLNNELKADLPLLSVKTNYLAQHCFGCFVNLQADWYQFWQKTIQSIMEYKGVPPDIQSIVETFSMDFNLLDSKAKELTMCNGILLKNAKTKEKEKEIYAASKESLSSRSTGQDSSTISSSRDSREQTSRPPSSSGKIRPPQLSTRTRAASTNGSPSLPTPDFGHTNGGFITPSQEHPLLIPQLGYGLGIQDSRSRLHDNNSMTETLVNSQPPSIHQSNGRPSTSRTSTHRSQAHLGGLDGAYDDGPRTYDIDPRKPSVESPYQTRNSESSYYWRRESDLSERSFDFYDKSRPVSGSTTFSSRVDGPPLNGRPPSGLDGPIPGRPYSGVFHSAMPMSEGPESYPTRISRTSSVSSDKNDDRGRGDGYNVLYLAASLFEFHITDTKREGIYPYLTYEAGEVFDVIGEKGELWLAKNQDDPPDKIKVGWIWSKHFARLAD